MKKFIILPFLLISLLANAKKVKFSVDFGTDSVSVDGVHIVGDFQMALGLPSNFMEDSTSLLQEGSTSIYSIVVDIPAFQKYEYLYINGSGYNTELPPIESQVTYNYKVHRFFYLDSLANDTTNIGAVRYGMNAPSGKKLLRFKVDMKYQTVSANGVHVYGGVQGSTKQLFRMCPLGDVYHYITYLDSGNVTNFEYDFINGNTIINKEIKDATCANSILARISIDSIDRELDTVCYASCKACAPLGFHNLYQSQENYMAINTMMQGFTLFTSKGRYDATIYNGLGQKIKVISNINKPITNLENLKTKGMYLLQLKNKETGVVQIFKFLQQ